MAVEPFDSELRHQPNLSQMSQFGAFEISMSKVALERQKLWLQNRSNDIAARNDANQAIAFCHRDSQDAVLLKDLDNLR